MDSSRRIRTALGVSALAGAAALALALAAGGCGVEPLRPGELPPELAEPIVLRLTPGQSLPNLQALAVAELARRSEKLPPSPSPSPGAPPSGAEGRGSPAAAPGEPLVPPELWTRPLGEWKAEELLRALGSRRMDVRWVAGIEVVRRGERRAVPILVALVDAGDPFAAQACALLGLLGDESAVGALARAARGRGPGGRRPKEVRLTALYALARLGTGRRWAASSAGVSAVLASLEDDDELVRACAAVAGGCLGWEGPARTTCRARLRAVLRDAGEEAVVRAQAALALRWVGSDEGFEFLSGLAGRSSDPSGQRLGVQALSRWPEPRAAAAMAGGLESGFPEVWTTAVDGYAILGLAASEPTLRRYARAASPAIAARAKMALAAAGSPDRYALLGEVLASGDLRLRAAGCSVLGALGEARAYDVLVERLKDDSPSVRSAAALALARLGDERAVGPLGDLAGDAVPAVRAAAATAIAELRGKLREMPRDLSARYAWIAGLEHEAAGEALRGWTLERVLADAAGNPVAAVLRSPEEKTGRIFRVGDVVYGGYRVETLRAAKAADANAPALPASVALARGEAALLLVEGMGPPASPSGPAGP